jgi:uncharacterized protein YnzC (UPF0291/DUF896 family)
MKIKQIGISPNFDGKIVVKNAISSNQKHLFDLHKNNLDMMIKDMPFDLFVKQSKSKKTISLSASVDGASAYIVRKNKQDFETAASLAIEEGKKKSKLYQDTIKAQKILDVGREAYINMVLGNFKEARKLEKEHAKLALADFELYKQIPHLVLAGVPKEIIKQVQKNGFKYMLYKLFSTKSPEEKQFLKMRKEYLKQLKSENKQIKTVTITLPQFY